MLLNFAKTWWGQVFMLLALIAILDRATGFKTDIGALSTASGGVINDLKV